MKAEIRIMRIVFMGTPDFAAGILKCMIDAGKEIVSVYTQPDRPQGRSQTMTAPPVKVLAKEHGIAVHQPEHVRRKHWIEKLTAEKPDLIVVAAFGQLLSSEILSMAPCINVHASLLPLYRGSSPIQRAIQHGDAETGVTIMRMDEGMDTGNILLQKKVPITDSDTGESMFDKLAVCGQEALLEVLTLAEQGADLTGIVQDHEKATSAPIMSREDGRIDWTAGARLIDCHVRAFTPWPSTFTQLGEKTVKILKVRPFIGEGACAAGAPAGQETACEDPKETEGEALQGNAAPGTICSREEVRALFGREDHLLVHTGSGLLEIEMLQLPGKKAMKAADFLRGNPVYGKEFGR